MWYIKKYFFIDMKFGINQTISQTITQLSCIQLETPSSRLWNFDGSRLTQPLRCTSNENTLRVIQGTDSSCEDTLSSKSIQLQWRRIGHKCTRAKTKNKKVLHTSACTYAQCTGHMECEYKAQAIIIKHIYWYNRHMFIACYWCAKKAIMSLLHRSTDIYLVWFV